MDIQRLQANSDGVTELALDAKRRVLVVGDDAGVLSIWKLDDHPAILRYIEPPFTNINTLDWLPDCSGFVTAGDDGIGAWLLDGSGLGVWPTVDAVPQSIAVVDQTHALVAYDDSRLCLIDFAAGAIRTDTAAGERNTGIARHPDGCRFAISACDQGGSAIQWVRLEGHALQPLAQPIVERNVDHLSTPAIDGSGEFLMAADHHLRVYDAETGQCLRTFDLDGRRVRISFGDRLLVEQPWTQCVAVGPSGLACASPNGPLLVFDTSTERLTMHRDLARPATALTADGSVLAAACLDWNIVIFWP